MIIYIFPSMYLVWIKMFDWEHGLMTVYSAHLNSKVQGETLCNAQVGDLKHKDKGQSVTFKSKKLLFKQSVEVFGPKLCFVGSNHPEQGSANFAFVHCFTALYNWLHGHQ